MPEFKLFPYPKSLERRSGFRRLDRELRDALPTLSVFETTPRMPAGISQRTDSSLAPEEYRLSVSPTGVEIVSSGPSGTRYALVTLYELADTNSEGIPCCEIADRPDFAVRGVMLDISRDKVPTMETLCRTADLLRRVKINQLQLYTEHTFAYRRHIAVWQDASPLTAEEIREFDRYCAERGIELVPNQNSFGHMERWLVHPAYEHLAEAPNGFVDFWGNRMNHPFSLSPAVPEAVPFLAELYDELLPNFRSRLFNVGADETFDLGQGRSRERCEREGVATVYLEFLERIHRLVSERDHTMLFWGDIVIRHPELIPELPSDTVALTWGYEADHPFAAECEAFGRAGLRYYVCPGTSSWNAIGGRWRNARLNILSAAEAGRKSGAEGVLVTDWGDNGHWQQYPIMLPGILYGAGVSWNLDGNGNAQIDDVLSRIVFRDRTGDAARALLELGDCYLNGNLQVPNAAPFAIPLAPMLAKAYENRLPDILKHFSFDQARRSLDTSEARIRRAEIASDDGETLRDEMMFTVGLLRHAISVLEAVHEAGGTTEGMDRPTRERLSTDLSRIGEEFRSRWLKRNRPGGLDDSIGKLGAPYRLR